MPSSRKRQLLTGRIQILIAGARQARRVPNTGACTARPSGRAPEAMAFRAGRTAQLGGRFIGAATHAGLLAVSRRRSTVTLCARRERDGRRTAATRFPASSHLEPYEHTRPSTDTRPPDPCLPGQTHGLPIAGTIGRLGAAPPAEPGVARGLFRIGWPPRTAAAAVTMAVAGTATCGWSRSGPVGTRGAERGSSRGAAGLGRAAPGPAQADLPTDDLAARGPDRRHPRLLGHRVLERSPDLDPDLRVLSPA